MTTDELRSRFLEFFREKEHAIISSASVIPENDPTVLFTTAGMHPLVPYLLGEKHPAGRRLANSQKCVRTGDIDEGLVSRLLESLVDAGRVTSVPVRQRDGARSEPAYGLPQNSL